MEKYSPIALCDTQNMSYENWLKMRQGKLHGIPCTVGGSEVAAIFDVSPWVTSMELHDKKSGIKPEISMEFNEENKKFGHIFEKYVQELFIEWFKRYYHIELKICKTVKEFNETTNGIYNDTRFYQHGNPDYSFAVANVDGLIKVNGRIGILEYKTTTPKGNIGKNTTYAWKQGQPPIYYETQCRHYMGVLQVDFCFLCCAWGFSLDSFSAIYLERDESIENILFEGENTFVQSVLSCSTWIPSACNSTLLTKYYTLKYGEAKEKKSPVLLNKDYFPLLEQMVKRSKYRKELEEALNKLDEEDDHLVATLYPIIGDASFCICRNEAKTIFLEVKTPKQRFMTHEITDNALCSKAGFDIERFSEEHPDLLVEFTKPVFDVKTFKVTNTALFNQYKREPKPTGDKSRFTARFADDE